MKNIMRKYADKRKKALSVFVLRETGEAILHGVPGLLNENKDHKINYFIKKCQTLQGKLLLKCEEEISISGRLRIKISQLEIKDLEDCESFGRMLLDLHKELVSRYNIGFLFYKMSPMPLNYLEVVIVLLTVLTSVKVASIF